MKLLFPKFLIVPAMLGLALCSTAREPENTKKESAPKETESAAGTQIDHVDAAGAAKLLASADKPAVLDVRTPEEYAAGHIKGATMVDFTAASFESELAKLDKDQTYLVHCRSGHRSTSSLPIFEKLGFKHIVHLDGGFSAWTEAGQPVVK